MSSEQPASGSAGSAGGAFLAEIAEAPAALERLLAWSAGPGAAQLEGWRRGLAGMRRVLAVGMGTSGFAPLTMQDGLAAAGLRLSAEDAGEWLHGGGRPAADERLVLCSQSGRSVELVRLVAAGVPAGTVAITNDAASPLARAGGPVLLLQAGDEAAISTKTYVNTLALGHLMGAVAAGDASWMARLAGVAGLLRTVDAGAVAAAADRLAPAQALAVVGRGPAVPAVRQLALTVGEGAGLLAAPFVGGAFRHGPMEACGPALGVVGIAGDDARGALVLGVCGEAAALGCPVAVLTDRSGVPEGCVRVPLPPGPDAADIALRASRAQALLVHELAARRGRCAGVFRVNAKVTVRE